MVKRLKNRQKCSNCKKRKATNSYLCEICFQLMVKINNDLYAKI